MPKEIPIHVQTLTDAEIARTVAAFEEQFGMTSVEFLAKYNRGELGDAPPFIDWAGLLWLAHKVEGTAQART